jgi:hypothetical protein
MGDKVNESGCGVSRSVLQKSILTVPSPWHPTELVLSEVEGVGERPVAVGDESPTAGTDIAALPVDEPA